MSAFQQLRKDPRNPQAFDAWYRETYPKLYMAAFRMTQGDRQLAEDLCHDAILAFLTRGGIGKVTDEGGAFGYLRKSIAHAHIDKIRHDRRESAVAAPPELAGESTALDRLLAQEKYASVVEEFGADGQELLGMLLAGVPLAEIARTLGISYSNAGKRVHEIRKFINSLQSSQ